MIYYAIQRLNQVGKEKFGTGHALVLKQIFMNGEVLELVSKSSMWSSLSDESDNTLVGELCMIGDVYRLKTMPESRIQLRVETNDGHVFSYALFGMIDIV